MIRTAILGISLGALCASNLAPAGAATPLRLHDLRGVVQLRDPQISPDGKTVAVVVRRADYTKDAYRSQIVLVDVRSGRQTAITRISDEASAPRWSPDGTRIAFLARPLDTPDAAAADSAKDQIDVVAVGGGAPRTISAAKSGVEAYAWDPSGTRFAYIAREPAPNQKQIDAKDDGFDVGDNQWNTRAAPLPQHVWIVGAAGGKATALTAGPASATGDPVWSPDGRRIVFRRYPDAYTQHYAAGRLMTVDVATRRVAPFGTAQSADPVFSRDGTRVAFAVPDSVAFAQSEMRVGPADGSASRVVTARLDRNIGYSAFTPDRSALIVEASDGTRDRLFRVTLADGAVAPLPLGSIAATNAVSQSKSGTLALVGATPAHPNELFVMRPGDPAPRRITNLNGWIAARGIAPSRTIAWRSADGFAVDGVLTEPLGGVRPGKRYPLVLVIHGGPTATSTTGWDELTQLMSARGWFTFAPNYRGSDNAGRRFAQATVPHITSAPAGDVMDGLAHVLRSEPIDTTRIGVSGWSEGGLLTSWLIGHDTRWKAAMSGAAVNDWLMYADLTDAQDFTPNYIAPQSPWTNPAVRALYAAESPLTYAARVKTPTLIMTDAGDQRVPEPLSYAFYHAIRAAGTPVTMVVIPVDGHFPADPVRIENVFERWVDWFATHL